MRGANCAECGEPKCLASATTSWRGLWPIVTPDGYILTNSHVVSGASTVVGTFVDGEQARGRLVGDDPATDLALVRVQGDPLPPQDLMIELNGQLVTDAGSLHRALRKVVPGESVRVLVLRDGVRLQREVVTRAAP